MRARTEKSELDRGLDSVCIVVAFAGATEIATVLSSMGLFRWPIVGNNALDGWPPDYLLLLVVSLVIWAVVSVGARVYEFDRLEGSKDAYLRLGRALVLWIGAATAATFFLKLQTLSRQFNLSFFALATVLIFARTLFERETALRKIRSDGRSRRAVIIGPRRDAEWLLGTLSKAREWRGSIDIADTPELQELVSRRTCKCGDGGPDDLAEVFLLPGLFDQSLMEKWTVRFVKQGMVVHVIPGLIDTKLFRCSLGDIAGVPTVTLETANPHHLEIVVKRLVDIAVAAALLLLLGPVMALIGLLVKLTSPGPAIFSQERLGRNGRIFTIFKFRSMEADAEQVLLKNQELYELYKANNFKLPEGRDHRVTKLGKVLRASSLDELPQLFNVLRGDMSLVGPRPIVPEEIERYGEYTPVFLSLKPGITGNWQVSGRSRVTNYSDRVRLDLEYVRDQSARKDLEILVRTVGAVTRMDGAY